MVGQQHVAAGYHEPLDAMKINNKYELLALHRCLLEAKFNSNPDDLDIAGSPLAAKLSISVVEELRNIEGEEWDEWRIAENHPDRIQNLIYALKKQNLNHYPDVEARRSFIKDALAPLIASEETISKIIEKTFCEK